jgi:hypothetical protein
MGCDLAAALRLQATVRARPAPPGGPDSCWNAIPAPVASGDRGPRLRCLMMRREYAAVLGRPRVRRRISGFTREAGRGPRLIATGGLLAYLPSESDSC